MESWVGRLAGAGGAGRSATSIARIETAKAIAELRNLTVAEDSEDGALVAGYLRRCRSLLSQAAHDIERNRYSLQQLDAQMHRLDEVTKRIFPDDSEPGENAENDVPVEPGEGAPSGKPASGAND
jgi:hypothetical protein